jgi:hypothetical protein
MLETLANLAQVLGASAVLAAIIFGVAQIRQFHQQRRDALAVELMRSIQDAEFTRSLRLLVELPEGISAAEFRALSPEYEEAAWAMGAKYETLGYLIFRGIMPVELVEDLLGGVGVHLWSRLGPWVASVREEQRQPLMLEWFQWLVQLLEARERPKAVPAYLLHQEWQPPRVWSRVVPRGSGSD